MKHLCIYSMIGKSFITLLFINCTEEWILSRYFHMCLFTPHDRKYFGNFMVILGLKGQKFWNAG